MLQNRSLAWGLVAPLGAWLALFFILPMAGMALLSLRPDLRGGLVLSGWQPTLVQYQQILTGGIYLPLFWLSVRVAAGVALAATLLVVGRERTLARIDAALAYIAGLGESA